MSLIRRCTSAQRCKPNTVWLSPQHLDGEWATIYPEWPHAHHQRIPIWHYRPRALRIRRSGCHGPGRGRGPRATRARAGVICMREFPGLAQPAPRGPWRLSRSQAHAHVHSTCAARVALAHDIAHVASELALRATSLCSCPPGLPAAPAPGHVRSGQGRAPGAAPDARLHTSQLSIRGRRHLRVALEISPDLV